MIYTLHPGSVWIAVGDLSTLGTRKSRSVLLPFGLKFNNTIVKRFLHTLRSSIDIRWIRWLWVDLEEVEIERCLTLFIFIAIVFCTYFGGSILIVTNLWYLCWMCVTLILLNQLKLLYLIPSSLMLNPTIFEYFVIILFIIQVFLANHLQSLTLWLIIGSVGILLTDIQLSPAGLLLGKIS